MNAEDDRSTPAPPPNPQLSAAKVKYLADVVKSLGVVLTGAAVVTPAFSGRPVGTLNVVWLLIAFALILSGFMMTPKE